jgi:hypothetical protein
VDQTNLDMIRLFPKETDSGHFDWTKPVKSWKLPPGYADPNHDPDMPDYIKFDTPIIRGGKIVWIKFPVLISDAMVSNPMPPLVQTDKPVIPEVYIPMDKTMKNIPKGMALVINPFSGNLTILPSSGISFLDPTPIEFTQGMLNKLNTLAAKMGI